MNIQTKKINKKVLIHSDGFTILEMLVSVVLFTTIVVMAVGVIIITINANKRTRSLSVSMGNIEFHLEKIFREASGGTNYHCAKMVSGFVEEEGCSDSFHNFFGLTDYYGNDVYYRQNGTEIEASFDGGITFMPITDDVVVVQNFGLMVIDSDSSSTKDPRALYVSLSGRIGDGGENDAEFNFQTMIAQRLDMSILVD